MFPQDISTDEIKLEKNQNVKKQGRDVLTLGGNAINQLQLKVDMSQREDVEQVTTLLVQLLNYPNEEKAEIHSNAMRLGNFDLQKPVSNRSDTQSSLVNEKQNKICQCCGFIKQTDTIGITTSFDEIKNMGVSTYLYFSNYKKLAILLFILTIIYSVYALITNYIASRNGSLANSQTSTDYISISLSSKETNDNSDNRRYYFTQCWLGVVTIVAWIFALGCIRYNQIKGIQEYDNDTISCSDYSVVMQGMPLDVTKEELQKQLEKFYEGLNPDSIPLRWRKPFKISKLNVGKPFYLLEESFKDEQIQSINKQLEQTKEKLINLVMERQNRSDFSLSKPQRKALYQNYKTLNKKKMDKLEQISKNIKKSLKEQPSDEITTVFVTLQTNIARSYLEQLHEPSVFGRIKSICGKSQDKFWYEKDQNLYQLEIRRAPQPQDIIWTNLGQKDCSSYLKKLFTFTITLVLLGICFAIVFGLSRAQEDSGGSRPISIAISLTISIVNVMLGQIIRRLTVYEKDYTQTYRQASLAIKSVLAQMINTIMIPIIIAYYVKSKNFYFENGLVDNIFMLSISTIIIPPFLVLINPYRIAISLYRCYMSSPQNKLTQSQKQYNILQQGVQFQVGYQSIYPVSTFMFVCFYVSLQPIISVIALIGYFLMYWVQKYSLLNRYRRPVPGMDFVNNAIYKMISFGPIVYAFGSLTWANFSPNGIPPQAIIPNLIALGVGVILFIIPFNSIIIGACMSDNADKPTLFDDDRIFMPSQYDRLNPNTQAEGFEDYKKYMQRKKEQIKNLNKEQQAQFSKKMMINAQRGQIMNQARAQNPQNFNFFQPSYNYYQPQPAAYGYSPYAPMGMSYMGYNPMAGSVVGGYGMMPPAPVMAPAPVIVHVPQQVQRQASNIYQQNYPNGYNPNQPIQQPSYNPNSSQQAMNYNPYNQSVNNNPLFPQNNGNVINNPAFNPFNSLNNLNNANSAFNPNNLPGRKW